MKAAASLATALRKAESATRLADDEALTPAQRDDLPRLVALASARALA